MKKMALVAGLMLTSTAVFSSQNAFIEKYNPADKRAERPADKAPLFVFLYTTEDGRRKARKKDEEGYKPMPLKEGGMGAGLVLTQQPSEKKAKPKGYEPDASAQMKYRSMAHGRF